MDWGDDRTEECGVGQIAIVEGVLLVVVIGKPSKKYSDVQDPTVMCLSTLKSTVLLAIFKTPQLEVVAQEVESTLVEIMKEAAVS